MAAPKKNLLSLGHLTGTERKTKQREHSLQNSTVMSLQQHWQELKERELAAQKHNKQLLQQFDRAQDTLRGMLACNAAMKTIRMEYERYLEESAPRWQQQLKEKTQAAQRKRMEEYLRTYLKKTKQEQKSPADQPTLSHNLAKNAQKVSTPQKDSKSSHSDYNQDVSSHHPFIQSSWLTHTLSPTARFPFRAPSHLQDLSHVPAFYLPPPPHRFPHQPFDSTSPHHHPWPRQNPPSQDSPQPDYPWSGSTGAAGFLSSYDALWGPLYMREPLHERGEEAETSRTPSSKKRSNGSRNRSLSQELDIKPVRLSSGHAESSESSRDSIQTSRGKRKKKEKRGENRHTPSDRGRCRSQRSSATSSSFAAGVPVVQGSECDSSSDKGSISVSRRTRTRSWGLAVGSPRMEEIPDEILKNNKDNSQSQKGENHSTDNESSNQTEEIRSENALNPSPDDKPDTCAEEESESVSIKIENGVAEKEKQKRSSAVEESSSEENNLEGDDSDGEEKEDRLRIEGEDETDEDEDKDTGTEDEMEDQGDNEDSLKNEEGKNRRQGFATSQDEEADKDESEPDEDEDEEQRSDEAEEDRDSEDSIISPQANRLKKMHSIQEEAAEDDNEQEDSQPGSSDENSNGLSEDDIEDLLAPQDQTKKKEKNYLKIDTKSEATCDNVEIFQVELDDLAKTKDQSDSDEFDHFYD